MQRAVSDFTDAAGRQQWNELTTSSPLGHLMQTCEWADYKSELGWSAHRLAVAQGKRLVAGAQVLVRRLPLLPLSIAYVPRGPMVDLDDEESAALLLSAIHAWARSQRAVFLKIDSGFADDERFHAALRRHGFRHTERTVQPRSTIIMDLSSGTDAVWAKMRQTTRRYIRRAGKAGVTVTEGGDAELEQFYNVLKFTGQTKQFTVHNEEFYELAWQAFRPSGRARLLLAMRAGEVVAGIMLFCHGSRTMVLWTGTSNVGREVFASYLLWWEAMRYSYAQGYACLDTWGIPDEIADMLRVGADIPMERTDGMWGIYHFKRGLGGEIESYCGAYDYVYMPALYNVGMLALANTARLEKWSSRLDNWRKR
jgi:lipid II:glycine glycyltransferase (peptidoglycan interpeptide bridge formation enzyme)